MRARPVPKKERVPEISVRQTGFSELAGRHGMWITTRTLGASAFVGTEAPHYGVLGLSWRNSSPFFLWVNPEYDPEEVAEYLLSYDEEEYYGNA